MRQNSTLRNSPGQKRTSSGGGGDRFASSLESKGSEMLDNTTSQEGKQLIEKQAK